jgi:8-amino-7-oxononanoate synthase
LTINSARGDALRRRVAGLVRRFRGRFAEVGVHTSGGLFPVQTLPSLRGVGADALYYRLLKSGIRTVLHRARNAEKPKLSFLITARHARSDIDRAVRTVLHVSRRERSPNYRSGENNETGL